MVEIVPGASAEGATGEGLAEDGDLRTGGKCEQKLWRPWVLGVCWPA